MQFQKKAADAAECLLTELDAAALKDTQLFGMIAPCVALAEWQTAADGTKYISEQVLLDRKLAGDARIRSGEIYKILMAYQYGAIEGEGKIIFDEKHEGAEKFVVGDKESNLWKAIDAAQKRRAEVAPSTRGLGNLNHNGTTQLPGNGLQQS